MSASLRISSGLTPCLPSSMFVTVVSEISHRRPARGAEADEAADLAECRGIDCSCHGQDATRRYTTNASRTRNYLPELLATHVAMIKKSQVKLVVDMCSDVSHRVWHGYHRTRLGKASVGLGNASACHRRSWATPSAVPAAQSMRGRTAGRSRRTVSAHSKTCSRRPGALPRDALGPGCRLERLITEADEPPEQDTGEQVREGLVARAAYRGCLGLFALWGAPRPWVPTWRRAISP